MPIDIRDLGDMVGGDGFGGMPPRCLACGYDLTGSVSDRCPECGNHIVRKELQAHAAEIRQRIRQIEESYAWVSRGFSVALAGVVIRLLCLLCFPSGFLAGLGQSAGIVLGFVALFLGMGALRIKQLPPWAREQVSVEYKPAYAFGAVTIGAILIVTGIISPW